MSSTTYDYFVPFVWELTSIAIDTSDFMLKATYDVNSDGVVDYSDDNKNYNIATSDVTILTADLITKDIKPSRIIIDVTNTYSIANSISIGNATDNEAYMPIDYLDATALGQYIVDIEPDTVTAEDIVVYVSGASGTAKVTVELG